MAENSSPSTPFRFHIVRETPGQDAAQATATHLAAEVAAVHGPRDEQAFALAARDEAGAWIGGINGVIHWRWLYVAQFFVAPEWRGRGSGRALLAEAEDLARENGCVGIYLDTFSKSAVAYYLACGFEIAGRIGNFPPGSERTLLFRALAG